MTATAEATETQTQEGQKRFVSPETRAKMSASQRQRWEERRKAKGASVSRPSVVSEIRMMDGQAVRVSTTFTTVLQRQKFGLEQNQAEIFFQTPEGVEVGLNPMQIAAVHAISG